MITRIGQLRQYEKSSKTTANMGFAIAGFRASQTHLCKVEVQF
jgi:hypothetical protein